jgi:hypothetical protein
MEVLRGEFLFNEMGIKGWRLIIFLMVLMLLMVYSSHKVDEKVLKIARLSKLEKEKRAEFISTRSEAMKKKLRSYVESESRRLGLAPTGKPVIVIHAVKKDE